MAGNPIGDTLTLAKNGVVMLSAAGGFAITDAGLPGIGSGSVNPYGKIDSSLGISNLWVRDYNGVPPPTPPTITFDAPGCAPAAGSWVVGQPAPPIQTCPSGVHSITVTVP